MSDLLKKSDGQGKDSKDPGDSNDQGTRQAIVGFLKRMGPSDAATIAEQFDVSAMAIRSHLYEMQDAGLITYEEQKRPVGRPAKLWKLTDQVQKLFPDSHAELSVSLIQIVTEAFGGEGMDKILELRAKKQIEAYQKDLSPKASIRIRVEHLKNIREREGYMAKVEPQEDGSFLLIENHCPVCSAAKTCQGLCRSELAVFREVMGKGCKVERTEHLMGGARRCVYRVSKA